MRFVDLIHPSVELVDSAELKRNIQPPHREDNGVITFEFKRRRVGQG